MKSSVFVVILKKMIYNNTMEPLKDSVRIEYEKKYHLINNKQFSKVLSSPAILNKYVIKFSNSRKITDTYYDTPEFFLKNAGLMFRTRVENNKKYITIKTNFDVVTTANGTYTKVNEFETEIPLDDEPYDHRELIIKHVPIIYHANLQATLQSILSNMKPVLQISYKKNIYHIVKNKFKAEMLNLSDVVYHNFITKKKAFDDILEIQLYVGDQNIDELLMLGKIISQNIKPLVEYGDLKMDVALRLTK